MAKDHNLSKKWPKIIITHYAMLGHFWNCLSCEMDNGSWHGGVGFKKMVPVKKSKRAQLRSDADPQKMTLKLACVKDP